MHFSLFAGVALASLFVLTPNTTSAEPVDANQARNVFPTSDSAAARREANRRSQNSTNRDAQRNSRNPIRHSPPPIADLGGGANMLLAGGRSGDSNPGHSRNRSRNNDHGRSGRNRDHRRADRDHRRSGRDHRRADRDHRRYGRDHRRADRDHRRYGRDHRRHGYNRDHHRYDHGRGHSRSGFSISIGTGYSGYGHRYGLGYGRNFLDHGYYSLLGGHHYRPSYNLYPWWYGDTSWGYRTQFGYRTGYGHIGHSNVFCGDYSHQSYTVNWQDPYSDHHAFSPYSSRTNGGYGGYSINTCRLENKRGRFNGRNAIVRSTVCWDENTRSYVDTGARQLIDFF